MDERITELKYRMLKNYLALLAILFISALAVADPSESTKKTPVPVGVILGLSGSMQEVAQQMRRGIDLALEENLPYPLELKYEDDRSMEHKEAAIGMQRLLRDGKVPLVLNWVNTTIPALAPIANSRKVPVIAFWDSNAALAKMGPYVFGVGISTELAGVRIADFVKNHDQIQNVALLSLHDPWSEVVAASFAERFRSLGGKIITEDVVDYTDKDLRAILVRTKAKGAEAIVAPVFFDSLYALVRQGKELGFAGKIYTGDSFFESDLATVGEVAEGVYSSQVIVRDEKFLKRYKEKYGNSSPQTAIGLAGLGYDAVKLASETISRVVSKGFPITGENIRSELLTIELPGVVGISVPGKESTKTEEITIVHNKTFVPVE